MQKDYTILYIWEVKHMYYYKINPIKRIISLVLTVLMLLSILPMSVFNFTASAADKTDSGQVVIETTGSDQYNNNYSYFTIYYKKGKKLPQYNIGCSKVSGKWYGPGNANNSSGTQDIIEKVVLENKKAKNSISTTSVPIYRLWRAGGISSDNNSVSAQAVSGSTDINVLAEKLKAKANSFIKSEQVKTITLSDTRAKMIGLVLQYGFRQHRSSSGASYYQDQLKYMATQILIWEIQEGKRKDFSAVKSFNAQNTKKWYLKDPDYWYSYWYNKVYKQFKGTSGYQDYYAMIVNACASASEPKVKFRRVSDNKVVTSAMNTKSMQSYKSTKSNTVKMTQSKPNYWSANVTFGAGYSSTYNYESAMMGVRYIGWDAIYATDFTNSNYKAKTNITVYTKPLLAYLHSKGGKDAVPSADKRFLDSNKWVIEKEDCFTIIGKTLNHAMYYVRSPKKTDGTYSYGYIDTEIYRKDKAWTNAEKKSGTVFGFDATINKDKNGKFTNTVTFYSTVPTRPDDNSDTKLVSHNFVRNGFNPLYTFKGGDKTKQGFVCGGNGASNTRYLNFLAKNDLDLLVEEIKVNSGGVKKDGSNKLYREVKVKFKNSSKTIDSKSTPFKIKVTIPQADKAVTYINNGEATRTLTTNDKLWIYYSNKQTPKSYEEGKDSITDAISGVIDLSKNSAKTLTLRVYTNASDSIEQGTVVGFNGIKVKAYINGGKDGKNNSRKYIEGTNNYRLSDNNKWYNNNEKEASIPFRVQYNQIQNYNIELTPKEQEIKANSKTSIKATIERELTGTGKNSVVVRLYKKIDNTTYELIEEKSNVTFANNSSTTASCEFENLTDEAGKTVEYYATVNSKLNGSTSPEHQSADGVEEYTYVDNVDDATITYFSNDISISVALNKKNVGFGEPMTGTVTIKNEGSTTINKDDCVPWSIFASELDNNEIITKIKEYYNTLSGTETEDEEDDNVELDDNPVEDDNTDDDESGFVDDEYDNEPIEDDNSDNNGDENGTVDDNEGNEPAGNENDDNISDDDENADFSDLDDNETDQNAELDFLIIAEGVIDEDLAQGKTVTYTFEFVYSNSKTDEGNNDQKTINVIGLLNGGPDDTSENNDNEDGTIDGEDKKAVIISQRIIEEDNYNNNIDTKDFEMLNYVDFGIELIPESDSISSTGYIVALIEVKNMEAPNYTSFPFVEISAGDNVAFTWNSTTQQYGFDGKLKGSIVPYYEKAKTILAEKGYDSSEVCFPKYFSSSNTSAKEISFLFDSSSIDDYANWAKYKYIAVCASISSAYPEDDEFGVANLSATVNLSSSHGTQLDGGTEDKFDFQRIVDNSEKNYDLKTYNKLIYDYSSVDKSNNEMYEYYNYTEGTHSYDNNFCETSIPINDIYNYRLNVVNAAGVSLSNAFDYTIMSDGTTYESSNTEVNNQGWCAISNNVNSNEKRQYCYRIDLEPNSLYSFEMPFFNGTSNFNNRINGKVFVVFPNDTSYKEKELGVNDYKISFETGNSEYSSMFIYVPETGDTEHFYTDIKRVREVDGILPWSFYENTKQIGIAFTGLTIRNSKMEDVINKVKTIYAIKSSSLGYIDLSSSLYDTSSTNSKINGGSITYTSDWVESKKENFSIVVNNSNRDEERKLASKLSVQFYEDGPEDILKQIDYNTKEVTGTNFAELSKDKDNVWKTTDESTYSLYVEGDTEAWSTSEDSDSDGYPDYIQLKLNNTKNIRPNTEYRLYFNNIAKNQLVELFNKLGDVNIKTEFTQLSTFEDEEANVSEPIVNNVFENISDLISAISEDEKGAFITVNSVCERILIETEYVGDLYLSIKSDNVAENVNDLNDCLENVSLYQMDNYETFENGTYDLDENDYTKISISGNNSFDKWYQVKMPQGSKTAQITITIGDTKPLDIEFNIEGEGYAIKEENGNSNTIKYPSLASKVGVLDKELGGYWGIQWRPDSSSSFKTIYSLYSVHAGVLHFPHVPDGEVYLYTSQALEKVVPYQKQEEWTFESNNGKAYHNVILNPVIDPADFAVSYSDSVESQYWTWSKNNSIDGKLSGRFTIDSKNNAGRSNHLALNMRQVADISINSFKATYKTGKLMFVAEIQDNSPIPMYDYEISVREINVDTNTIGRTATVPASSRVADANGKIKVETVPFAFDYNSDANNKWYIEVNYPYLTTYSTTFFNSMNYEYLKTHNNDNKPWDCWSHIYGKASKTNIRDLPFEYCYSDNYKETTVNKPYKTLYVNVINDIHTNKCKPFNLYRIDNDGKYTSCQSTGRYGKYFRNLTPGKYLLCPINYYSLEENNTKLVVNDTWYSNSYLNQRLIKTTMMSGNYSNVSNDQTERLQNIKDNLEAKQTTDNSTYNILSATSRLEYIPSDYGGRYYCAPIIEFECFGESEAVTVNIQFESINNIETDLTIVADHTKENDSIDVQYTIKNNAVGIPMNSAVVQMFAGNKTLQFAKEVDSDETADYFLADIPAMDNLGVAGEISGVVTITDVSSLGNGVIPISIEVNCPSLLTANGYSKYINLVKNNAEIKSTRQLVCWGSAISNESFLDLYYYSIPFEYDYVNNRSQTSLVNENEQMTVQIVNTTGKYVAGKEVITTCRLVNPNNAIYFKKAKLIGKLEITGDNGISKTVYTTDEGGSGYIVEPAADGDEPGINTFWFKWTIPENWNASHDENTKVSIKLAASVVCEDISGGANVNSYTSVDIGKEIAKFEDYTVGKSVPVATYYDKWLQRYEETGSYSVADTAFAHQEVCAEKDLQLLPNTTYVIKNNPTNESLPISNAGKDTGMIMPAIKVMSDSSKGPAEIALDFSGSDQRATLNQQIVFTTNSTGIVKIRLNTAYFNEGYNNQENTECWKHYTLECLLDNNKAVNIAPLTNTATRSRKVYSKYETSAMDTVYESSMPLDTLYDNSMSEYPKYQNIYNACNMMRVDKDIEYKDALAESGALAGWSNWVETKENEELEIKEYYLSQNNNIVQNIINEGSAGILNQNEWTDENGEKCYVVPLNVNTTYTLSLPDIEKAGSDYSLAYKLGSEGEKQYIWNKNNNSEQFNQVMFTTGESVETSKLYLLASGDEFDFEIFKKCIDGISVTTKYGNTSTLNGQRNLLARSIEKMSNKLNWRTTGTTYTSATTAKDYCFYLEGFKPKTTYKLTVPDFVEQKYETYDGYISIYRSKTKNGREVGNYLANYPLVFANRPNEERVDKTIYFTTFDEGLLYIRTNLFENEKDFQKMIAVLSASTLEEVGKVNTSVGYGEDMVTETDNTAFSVDYNSMITRDGIDSDENVHVKSGYGITYNFDPNAVCLNSSGTGKITADMLGNTTLAGQNVLLGNVKVDFIYPEFAYRTGSGWNDTAESNLEDATEYVSRLPDKYWNIAGNRLEGEKYTIRKAISKTHYTPIWMPDGEYTAYAQVSSVWTPAGECTLIYSNNKVHISGDLIDNWHLRHYSTVKTPN